MDKAAWRERFRLEQGSLAEEILRDLPRWSREELFRFFHSLRSQADFFHWESLSRTAEAGEDCLAGEAVETGRVREVLESLRETLNQGGGRQPVGRGIPAGAGRIAGGGLRPGAGGLSRRDIEPFAYTLLQEARERGEVPYHLSCRISREEPLPYARFFLIISRLEEMVNVIQVFPDLKTLEENPVDAVSLLISTRTGEEEIRRAVDVDNLERLTFIPMAYEDLLVPTDSLPGEEVRSEWQGQRGEKSLVVSVHQVETMERILRELRHRILSDPRRISWRAEALRDLRSLDRALGQVEMVSLDGLFQYLPEMAEDLARRAGKDVQLTVQGEGHAVDWTMMDPLFEVLLQLLRNAVDHGIEGPEERRRRGKDPAGRISVTAVRQGESLRIQVMDDGAGISLPEGAEAAGEEESDGDLLNYLARPGYTTRSSGEKSVSRESNSPGAGNGGAISGKGVGLDLAVRRVRDLLGGTLTLNSKPGEGAVFQILLPDRSHLQDLTILRAEGKLLALPGRAVLEIMDLGDGDILREDDGGLYVRSSRGRIPLYDPSGRLMAGESGHVSFPKAVVLTHLGLEGALGADQILEERQVLSRDVRLGYEREPHIHELALEGYEEPVLFVFPALVSRY